MDDAQIATGKLPTALLRDLLATLPRDVPGVQLGPALGEDACAIDVGGEALVVAADPITLTGDDVGRYAVVVNANDVAVMGARPRWFLATILLPAGSRAADAQVVFDGVRDALAEVGADLVGGHTEITHAVRVPVVAGTMLGTAESGRVVRTSGARAGDVVVQLGPAPVEGAAVLAKEAAGRLAGLSEGVLAAARDATVTPGISVVPGALRAAELGASSLHDPTEGGLASGLHEVATAAGVAVHVDRGTVAWFEPGVAVCAALGADPWATLASGCVVATFPRDVADRAVDALAHDGHDVAVIGSVRAGEPGVVDERGAALPWPARDEVARVLGG
jgi:hydrogenase maturation factor